MHSFRDVETAAFCPRKLYYRRRDGGSPSIPDVVSNRRALAVEYDRLLTDDRFLDAAPIDVTPTQLRSRLGSAKAKLGDRWERIVNPAERNVFTRGRDCQGIIHKRLGESPPSLSLVFTGRPPTQGVWESQSVRLVAAAKALSWETETAVDSVVAEYPAYGVIRPISVDVRRTARYREALRIAEHIEDPPARTDNREKCSGCEYRDQCGVRTRSMRSLLGG